MDQSQTRLDQIVSDKAILQEVRNIVLQAKPIYLQCQTEQEFKKVLELIDSLKDKIAPISDLESKQYFMNNFIAWENNVKSKLPSASILRNDSDKSISVNEFGSRLRSISERTLESSDENDLSVLKSHINEMEDQLNSTRGNISPNDYQKYMDQIMMVRNQINSKNAYLQVNMTTGGIRR